MVGTPLFTCSSASKSLFSEVPQWTESGISLPELNSLYRNQKISLVIPCYNEEEGLPVVLKEVPDLVDEIIVVDNNSTDQTGNIARDSGVKVIREMKKGYGQAFQTGFALVTGDIIITMDGDGTYPPPEIPRLLEILFGDELDFISACRFPLTDKGVMDPVSKFGNRILTIATRILFGNGLKDSQSGMWILRKDVWEKSPARNKGMAFSEEIKIRAILGGAKFREVHIPYRERFGKKKIRKFRDGMKNLIFLLKLRIGN